MIELRALNHLCASLRVIITRYRPLKYSYICIVTYLSMTLLKFTLTFFFYVSFSRLCKVGVFNQSPPGSPGTNRTRTARIFSLRAFDAQLFGLLFEHPLPLFPSTLSLSTLLPIQAGLVFMIMSNISKTVWDTGKLKITTILFFFLRHLFIAWKSLQGVSQVEIQVVTLKF